MRQPFSTFSCMTATVLFTVAASTMTSHAQVALGNISSLPGPIVGGASAEVARAAFLEANPGAGTFYNEGTLSRVYGPAFSSGPNAVASAERFLRAHTAMFGSSFAQLLPIGPNGDGTHVLPMGYRGDEDAYRFSLVGYTQHLNGVPVFRGSVRCLVRNEPGFAM